MFLPRLLRSRLAAAAAAATLAVTGLTLATAAPASASGCLSTLGPGVNVYNKHSTYQGTFYLGYDSCRHNVYAELDNPWNGNLGTYVQSATVEVRHVAGETLPTFYGGGFRVSYVSPMDYIYRGGSRQYNGVIGMQLGDGEQCTAYTATWNFANGTYSGWPSASCN